MSDYRIGRSVPPRPGHFTVLFDKPLDNIECRFELRPAWPRFQIIDDATAAEFPAHRIARGEG